MFRLQVRQGASPDHVRFQFLNVARGMTKEFGAIKAAGLARLAKSDGYPDFVAYTELSGPAGQGDVRKWLGPKMSRQYSIMLWSQRSVSVDGQHGARADAGGGIALLVHKRLRVTARQLPVLADSDEAALLDGHLRTWQFDHVGSRNMKRQPIVVTLAYFPPASGRWGNKVRALMARVLSDTNRYVADLRQSRQVFDVVLAHTNAPDGGCDVDIKSPRVESMSAEELDGLVELSESVSRNLYGLAGMQAAAVDSSVNPASAVGCRRGRLSRPLHSDHLRLHRSFSSRLAKSGSEFGRELVTAAADCGLCPLPGIMNHAQSTSWTKTGHGGRCLKCRIGAVSECARIQRCKKNAKRGQQSVLSQSCVNLLRMRSVHDVVWIQSDLIARALTAQDGGRHLVHSVTKRVIWAPDTPIDHAVTFVRLKVGRVPIDERSNQAAENVSRQPVRQHLPHDLLQRALFKSRCAVLINNRFSALDCSDATVDQLNAVLVQACAEVSEEVAMEFDQSTSVEPTFSDYRRCKRRFKKRHAQLLEFLKLPAPDKSAPYMLRRQWKQRRKLLNTRRTVAVRQLSDAFSAMQARRQSDERRRAPRKYWDRLRISAIDIGAPEAARSLIIDHQTSEDGSLLTADPQQCRRNMQSNRRTLYKVPRLAASCMQRARLAAAELHLENSLLGDVCPTSAAAQSALNPASPLLPFVEANGPIGDLTSEIDAARQLRQSPSYGMNSLDAEAVAERDRLFTVEEVSACLQIIQDVGPGTDGISPALFTAVGGGAGAEAICKLFNLCMQTGSSPSAWREHRTLFLYKGKDSDPFHLGNYRGISIDHFLLKLWSMMFTARLEVFLERCGHLSAMQGGFQRLRGTPESVISLSEAVRSTITPGKRPASSVELVFVDIKVAYDSVLHPILWQRCMSLGIGGKFLAALQAIYSDATSRVDVNGKLLDGVPLLRGVLQGNPLSPLLFNIYIDGAVRELGNLRLPGNPQPLGLWLPRAGTVGESSDSNDYLQCLFYADDGVGMECRHVALQAMVDCLATHLESLGLEINVPKTKWMIIPPVYYTTQLYLAKKQVALRDPLTVYGRPIALVDEFDYLGVRIWWRWDFSKAWELALQRARKTYFAALRGGWQRRSGSLVAMLDFARAKIFSHFHYIAAISGACGLEHAPWRKCEDIYRWVLRTITGLHSADVTALKIEAGIWDDDMHIHMMVLRFWRKCCSASPDTTFNRAIRAVMTHCELTPVVKINPLRNSGYVKGAGVAGREPSLMCRVSWGHALYAAAFRFRIPVQAVEEANLDIFTLVQKSVDDVVWATVPVGGVIGPLEFVRICARPPPSDDAVSVEFVEGKTCWHVAVGTSREQALRVWSPQLKAAVYASIRALGNIARHRFVQVYLNSQFVPDKNHKIPRLSLWARTVSYSTLQPYWYLDNVDLARWIVRSRFDQCPTEDYWRTAFHRTASHRQIPRIDDRHLRACYMCSAISGSQNIYWPETLEHVLLLCAGPELVACRRRFERDLKAFASSLCSRSVPNLIRAPDFSDASVRMTILQLCTGTGAGGGILLRQQVPAASTDPIILRQSPQFVRDSNQARHTVEWMQPLFHQWLEVLRNPRCAYLPQSSAGYRLVHMVAEHLRSMFSIRHQTLTAADSFQSRSRDPAVCSNSRLARENLNNQVNNTLTDLPAVLSDQQVALLSYRTLPISDSIASRTRSKTSSVSSQGAAAV